MHTYTSIHTIAVQLRCQVEKKEKEAVVMVNVEVERMVVKGVIVVMMVIVMQPQY
jgi:hypothetical protein